MSIGTILLVRYAWLGEFLNGYRRLRKRVVVPPKAVVVTCTPAIGCVNDSHQRAIYFDGARRLMRSCGG